MPPGRILDPFGHGTSLLIALHEYNSRSIGTMNDFRNFRSICLREQKIAWDRSHWSKTDWPKSRIWHTNHLQRRRLSRERRWCKGCAQLKDRGNGKNGWELHGDRDNYYDKVRTKRLCSQSWVKEKKSTGSQVQQNFISRLKCHWCQFLLKESHVSWPTEGSPRQYGADEAANDIRTNTVM
jgi:hypothetical protein